MQAPFLRLGIGAVLLGSVLSRKVEAFRLLVVLESWEMLIIFLIPFVGLSL